MTDATAAARAIRGTPSVAVVGLACRFPDADDPAALLDVVLTGRRSFRRLPLGRIDLADYYQADLATSDSTYSTRAALIEGWRFECAAFGIEPADYVAADQAHWLTLETAARALSAAGLPAGSGLDRDRTGVIIGNTLAGETSRANALRVRWPYVRRVLSEALGSQEISAGQAGIVLRQAESSYLAPFPAMGPNSLAGSMPGTIASAISTYFGFRGGSHAVDSACSSSLQAVASACAALASGDLDAAIAGGVDLSLDPLELIGLAKAGMLATTDVRIYDQNPTGYLPGEGCGVVVLMRTADARVAGLPVYAEILGWGTSGGGMPGEMQSHASSHLLAMRRAYERAGVDPADIQFIEGNGAGTLVDDEAELSALSTLRAGARQPAALGSVKANIGHAKAAAGAAGLIKTVLALGTGVVPPATGADRPHELIASGDANLVLPETAAEWADGTRLAAVSTMGIGGSNVHVVLRHEPAGRARQDRWLRSVPLLAKAARPGSNSQRHRLMAAPETMPFLLHAPDRFALASVLSRLAEVAGWMSDAEMQDLACTLGRDTARQGPARVALVATRQEQLALLASEAAALLPDLADGFLEARPGIFASDDADGRVTLLLSSDPAATSPQPDVQFSDPRAADRDREYESSAGVLTSAVAHCLDALRWLESLDVHATGAVAHGIGALAGLAWAGALGEREVVEIADLRAQYLVRSAARSAGADAAGGEPGQAASAAAGEGSGAAALRAAIAQRFRFGPPRRRLISTITGAEIESIDDAIDLICSGFAGADRLTNAIADGAVGATLLLETGPGRTLTSAAAEISRVPAISLQSGFTDPANSARVAAALFAAGALGQPQPLFAGRPARAVDIWREQLFITNPCQVMPRTSAATELAPEEPAANSATADLAANDAAFVAAGATGPSGPETAAGEDAAEPQTTEPQTTERRSTKRRSAKPQTTTLDAADKAADLSLAVPAEAVQAAVAPGQAAADRTTPSEGNGISSLRDEFERRLPTRPLIGAAAMPGTEGESDTSAHELAPAELPTPSDESAPADPDGPHDELTHAAPDTPSEGIAAAIAAMPESAVAESDDVVAPAVPAETAVPAEVAVAAEPAAAAQPAAPVSESAVAAEPAAPAEPVALAKPVVLGQPVVTGAGGPAKRSARSAAKVSPAETLALAAGDRDPANDEIAVAPPSVPAGQSQAVLEIAVPPSPAAGPVEGLGPWARCFTEGLRPAHHEASPAPTRSWRMYAAARSPMLTDLSGLFTADPSAGRTLAIVEDPADERSRVTAVEAARDAITTGELVVLTTSAEFSGFFATLHAEHPAIGITVVRVPASAASPGAVLQFASAERGQYRELVIAPTGTASEPVCVEVTLPGGGDFPLGPNDVILISRSTRGAGLALAQVLACCGTGIAIVGRGPEHDDAELVDGLEELRSAGARVGYEVIDIGDSASLAAAVKRIEDRLGPVTAIAHAADLDCPVPFLDMTDAQISAHLSAEISTLDLLAGSIRAGQLKQLISFGTVASRYGLAGASMHALSSGALASRAAQLADASIGCTMMHIDMPAWSTGGLGDRPERAAELAAADAPALEVAAASRMLFKVLTTGDLPRSLALHGRVGGLGATPAPVITSAELAAAGLPHGGRFLREVAVHYPGIELICSARLSLTSDPYLADYRIDGMPVLPPVLALEALAQAASVLAGRPVRRATGVALESSVLIPSTGQAALRVCALRDGDRIIAALRCADSSYRVDHARAEFSCADDAPETPDATIAAASLLQQLVAGASGLVDGAELYGPIFFQSGRFRRVALLPEVTARSGRALARGTDDQPWYPAGSDLAATGFLLGSPGLNDAALQVLQACVPHRRVRPGGCESVTFSGRDAEGPVEIRAIAEPVRPSMAAGPDAAPTSDQPSPPGQAPVPDEALAGVQAMAAVQALTEGQVLVPGQADAPESERFSQDRRPGAEVAGDYMTDEELADTIGADRRPQSRKSRRSRRQQGRRARQEAAGRPAYSATHTWEVEAAVVGRRPADQLDRADNSGPSAEAGTGLPAWSQAGPAAETSPLPVPQLWSLEAVDAAGQLLAWRGIQLRDSGPLPRNAAWPPTLLSVFLERNAADLGLDDGLRVTVSCGQPDGAFPQVASAVPQQSPPADGPAASGGRHAGPERRAMNTVTAQGTGGLAGFSLMLRAPVPVACGWVTVEAGRHQQQPAPGLTSAFAQLHAGLAEQPAVLAARLEAVGACLTMAGVRTDNAAAGQLTVTRTTSDGWAVFALGRAHIACAVVEISGVSAPVAIAILTRQYAHTRRATSRGVAARATTP